jgi:class 3 adenylate cyclase
MLVAIGATFAGLLLAVVLVRAVVHEQASQLGNALAADAAERAAEYLVHNDLVSLNVITGSISRQASVAGVVVYDRYRQPLAQSGAVQATPDVLLVRANILTEEQELRGTVEILLKPEAPLVSLRRFDYAMGGWFAFAVVLLVVFARLLGDNLRESAALLRQDAGWQPSPLPQAAAESVTDDVIYASHPVEDITHDSAVLRIDVVNFATMQQRVAPRMLDELVMLYADKLGQAAAFYQGEVTRPLDHQCLVNFPSVGGGEEEVLFRAICCAQLFFGVAREINTSRRALGKTTLQFSAALHHDPSLGRDERAVVTWEICTHAGLAGRLTVTDAISEHHRLGDRLVIDSGHRKLLQVELPAPDAGSEPMLQDVLALGVLRLADPYEELIARQVKRLCEAAAA